MCANAGDLRGVRSIPGWGRAPGEGNGNPLQYSCLENPLVREAWWAVIQRVAKTQTQLKRLSTYVEKPLFPYLGMDILFSLINNLLMFRLPALCCENSV